MDFMKPELKIETETASKAIKVIYWFAFLRLSISYRRAQLVNAGRMKLEEANAAHPNFKKVIRRYEKYGRVWRKNPVDQLFDNSYSFSGLFDQSGGIKILSRLDGKKVDKTDEIVEKLTSYVRTEWPRSGYKDQVILSIPKNIDKNNIYQKIKMALESFEDEQNEQTEQKVPYVRPVPWLEIPKSSKVRWEILERCYNLIILKSIHPELSALDQARFLGVSKDKVALLDEALALKDKVDKTEAEYDKVQNIHDYQLNIKAVVWKYTRRAYLLAENAARGVFPSLDEIDEKKRPAEFAYEHIAEMSAYMRDVLKLDGITNSFSNEFLSETAIAKVRELFPKHYEAAFDKSRKEAVVSKQSTEQSDAMSNWSMAQDLIKVRMTEAWNRD
jgi:hypothetical protein